MRPQWKLSTLLTVFIMLSLLLGMQIQTRWTMTANLAGGSVGASDEPVAYGWPLPCYFVEDGAMISYQILPGMWRKFRLGINLDLMLADVVVALLLIWLACAAVRRITARPSTP